MPLTSERLRAAMRALAVLCSLAWAGAHAATSAPGLPHRGDESSAGLAHATEDEDAAPAADIAADGPPLPSVAAAYRVTRTGADGKRQVTTWLMTRSPDLIAIRRGDVLDRWTRERAGLRLERTFFRDRTVVDYAPGELLALEVQPSWPLLGTLFDEANLPQLRRTGVTRSAHVVGYRGVLGHEQVTLEWDHRTRLPVALKHRHGRVTVHFERTLVQAVPPSAWQPLLQAPVEAQRLDAADFGDMEYDPVVRKAMAYDTRLGWRSAHAD